MRVGVQGELLGDLGVQGLDLLHEAGQDGEQGAGDVRLGGAVVADRAAGGGGQPGVQGGGVFAAGVALAFQPGGQPPGREPAGPVLAVEAGQERQADRGIEVAEQPDRAGEGELEVGAQLVAHRDAVTDQVLAGPAGLPQGDGGRAVRQQRPQPGPVGAQRVGQHERVEPIVLVARRPVAAPQVLQLVRADDHHGQPGLQQRVDHRAVRPLDRHLADACPAQLAHQAGQALARVLGDEPLHDLAGQVHHADGVIIVGPVDAAGHPARRDRGQRVRGILHYSLLAACPVGRHPYARCRDAAACPLTVRRSPAHTALSTVGAPRMTAGSRRTHTGRPQRRASRAVTRRHLGCISSLITADTRMVHQ